MGKYDISSKVLFKDYAEDFVRLTIKDRDFEIIETIPTELPIAEIRFTDAPVDDTFWYSLRYQVIRIAEIDGEKILSQKAPLGLLPFSAIMKRPEGVEKEEL